MSSASTPSVSLPSLSLEAFSKDCPHPSWTRSCSQMDDDVEYMGNYRPGGFHPVVLGDVFNNRYLVVHKLGQGGFATVWLVWDQVENCYVTLKIIRADRSEKCQELEILRYLGQFNIDLAENFICPLLDHFWVQGPNGSHACLVLPLAGLQVSDSIARSESYTNEERVTGARHYVRQLAHAVALLHSIGIVHGDLTGSNILTQVRTLPAYSLDELYNRIGYPQRVLISRWGASRSVDYLVEPADLSRLPANKSLLLVDFGEAFFINYPPPLGLGTPTRFAAPEGVFSKCASPASDIWAIGCLLYEWWSGRKLFEGENLEEISYDWTQTLGILPEPYWSRYTRREKHFDDRGKRIVEEGGQPVNVDLEYMMKEDWDRISTCLGALQKMQTNSTKQICNSSFSSSLHNQPKIRLSIIEDQTRRQLIITPELPCKMMAEPLSPASSGELHRFEPDATKIMNAEGFIFHSSNENSEVQLPPLIADLYCLLRQLLTYAPNKRLPALLISQHCWVSNPRRDENCQSVESIQDIEYFEQPSTPPFTPELNGSSNSVSDSKITKMAMPSKWSLVLDIETRTWKYVLSSDIKRADGNNECNCGGN